MHCYTKGFSNLLGDPGTKRVRVSVLVTFMTLRSGVGCCICGSF